MKKALFVSFSSGKKRLKREIMFPERPPISFFAAAQHEIDLAWLEKESMKKRIEELEAEIAKLNEIIDNPIDLSGD